MHRGMRGRLRHRCYITDVLPARAGNNARVISLPGVPRTLQWPEGYSEGYSEIHRRRYLELRPEKRVHGHSCEHSQSARSAAEIWLRASQFCGALRCPVLFAVAPPGPGTIYRGPELNGPRTKRHYISEKDATVRYRNREGWS